MPRPSKKVGVKKTSKTYKKKKQLPKKEVKTAEEFQEELDNLTFANDIDIVRESKDNKDINIAFDRIFLKLKPRIQKIVGKFNIPGYDSFDIMQEALYALRYKAIKDYHRDRGSCEGIAPFDRFALLCIRRHLSTEFKSSLQNNRKKVLNQSISIDQENKSAKHDDLYLSSIIPASNGDVLDIIQSKEYHRNLITNLLSQLSKFEKAVLALYVQKYSYEEIAVRINDKRVKVKVDVKGVDNALSRVKQKAREILKEYESKDDSELD